MLTFEQIKELIELVWERRLQAVEIERSGFRIRIDGRLPAAAGQPADGQQESREKTVAAASPGGALGAAVEPDEAATAEEKAELDGLHLLRSPIVGTFYTSPSPDADPYVAVGERVKRGQVLCIVEAMKLMNEIESDEDGIIDKVFPKNAQPVEYGEPLFSIRPES